MNLSREKNGSDYVSQPFIRVKEKTKAAFWSPSRNDEYAAREGVYYPVAYKLNASGGLDPLYPDVACKLYTSWGLNGAFSLKRIHAEIGAQFYAEGDPLRLIDPYLIYRSHTNVGFYDICRCEKNDMGERVDAPVLRVYLLQNEIIIQPVEEYPFLLPITQKKLAPLQQKVDGLTHSFQQQGWSEDALKAYFKDALFVYPKFRSAERAVGHVLIQKERAVVVESGTTKIVLATEAAQKAFPKIVARMAAAMKPAPSSMASPQREEGLTPSVSRRGNRHQVTSQQRKVESFWTPEKPDIEALFSDSDVVYFPVMERVEGKVKTPLYPQIGFEFIEKNKGQPDGEEQRGRDFYVDKKPLQLISRSIVDRLIHSVSCYDICMLRKEEDRIKRVLRVNVLSRDIRFCLRKDISSIAYLNQRKMFREMDEQFAPTVRRHYLTNIARSEEELGDMLCNVVFACSIGAPTSFVKQFVIFPTSSTILYERNRGLIAYATPAALQRFPKLERLVTKELR